LVDLSSLSPIRRLNGGNDATPAFAVSHDCNSSGQTWDY
jgi:hypothetical protein